MRAWRIRNAGDDPLAAEGPLAEALWSAGASAVWLDNRDLVGYFDNDNAAPTAVGAWEPVDERDHVAAYFEGLQAVDAGGVVIAPSHRPVTLAPFQQVVWLDPGSAFGTGHHPTTKMALEALGRLDLHGRRVLDVGAGSGVLALAASRLGAAEVLGIDVDASTVRVAEQNARQNHVAARFLALGFEPAELEGPFDVLVANLYAELHQRFAAGYRTLLPIGADLLLTGIMQPRELTLQRLPGFELVAEYRDDVWVLLHHRRAG
jgi:ribosomal protein L11 methyltransferase